MASNVLITIRLSWTFAPLNVIDSGIPFPSVKICRFTPIFARSVGFFPVWAPLLEPSLSLNPSMPNSRLFHSSHCNILGSLCRYFWKLRHVPISEIVCDRFDRNQTDPGSLATGSLFSFCKLFQPLLCEDHSSVVLHGVWLFASVIMVLYVPKVFPGLLNNTCPFEHIKTF